MHRLENNQTFSEALNILKHHNCKIMEAVDAEERSHFVKWIESPERLTELR
jgi:hypothetical protein